jgi:hypothetical protein
MENSDSLMREGMSSNGSNSGPQQGDLPASALDPIRRLLGARSAGADTGASPPGQTEDVVLLLHDLLQFALKVEKLLTAQVNSYHGAGQGRNLLVGHGSDLSGYVAQILQRGGRAPRASLASYLQDLNVWLVASSVAHRNAPKKWLEDWWQKYNPDNIKRQAGGKKSGWFSGGGDASWKKFEEIFRETTRSMAEDQIEEMVAEIARHFHSEHNSSTEFRLEED